MLRCTQLVGFDWLNSAAAATATATATATGTAPTVTSVGNNTGSTTTSSITFTVPAGGIPAASTVIVCAGAMGSAAITGGSDTKGNTYTVGIKRSESTLSKSLSAGFIYAQNITALVSGDVITITFASSMGNRIIVVGYATGLTNGSLIDKNASAQGESSAPSSGATASTTIASELAVGFSANEAGAGETEASGYTVISNTAVGGPSGFHLRAAYKVLSVTAAQTYTPTFSSSVPWICAVETLKT